MEHTQQQWKELYSQVQRLKKQNQQLKQLLKIQMTKSQSKLQKKRQFQSFKPGVNLFYQQQKQVIKDTQQLKKQWEEWSNRLQASLLVKNHRIRHKTQFQDLRKTSNLNGSSGSDGFYHRHSIQSIKSKNQEEISQIKIQSAQKIEQKKKLKIIQGVFLYGPNLNQIQESQQRKFVARHELYYPKQKKEQFEIYGNYFYPNQLSVKNIRQKNHPVQINTMIFKNSKKQQCNVFIFQGQHHPALKQKNQLIQKINPSKWLYAISIQFSDFIALQNHKIQDKINRTHSMLIENTPDDISVQPQLQSKQAQFERQSKKNIQKDPAVFKSTYCLCIMTYFPFIRLLKQILIQIFDSIKVKRMKIYQQSTSPKQIDIYSFIQQLKGEIQTYINQKLQIQPKINGIYDIQFNQQKPYLDLKQEYLMYELIGDWAFKILKTIDKDSLYQIYLYTLMEESICFICQDSHFLTFLILFFISILSLPFGYPHPCISIVFNDQLLQTPFTAILGINKNTKWLQENIDFLIQDKQNKIIVNLNDEEIKIKSKKKVKLPKSQKLKKIFNNFYKKIQTSAIPSIFKKKIEFNSRQTTKQQNDFVITMFAELNQFYIQEIFANMPNKQIIQYIRESCNTQTNNHTQISNKLIEKIETYLHQSRKGKQKDLFIQALLQRQLFYVYLARTYDIQ